MCSLEEFTRVQLVYPDVWKNRKGSNKFNWFICGQKFYDNSTRFTYLYVSNSAQFYCGETGKTFLARGLSDEEGKMSKAKLLIASDPENKIKLNALLDLKCYSHYDTLSHECDLVDNREHLLSIARYAVENLGVDGIVVKKECDDENSLICSESIFIFRDGVLIQGTKKEKCDIVNYAIQKNTHIRQYVSDFPTVEQINRSVKSCESLSEELYSRMKPYLLATREY